MARRTMAERTRTEIHDDSLILDDREDGQRLLFRGPHCIASEDAGEIGRLGGVALRILRRNNSAVAVFGLGFGILPRFLDDACAVTVYEIDPVIVDLFRQDNPRFGGQIVIGDFRQTISGQYDFIVNDTGIETDHEFLNGFLRDRGRIITP